MASKPIKPPAPVAPKGKTGKTTITNKTNNKGKAGGVLTPTPTKNNPNSFADADYWDQLNALLNNADNYRAQDALMKSRINEDYGISAADLAKKRGRDLTNIREDFAARGVVKSGGYGTRVGDYESDYTSAVGALDRSKNRGLQDISQAYNNYLEQWRLQKQQAVNDAIQRKLAKLKK